MTTVVGAGMAGLLAGGMLRTAKVIERSSSIPNNHSAVLRFRSTAVSDALSIPFKKVKAFKAIERWRNPIADALAYSMKTNGTATLRSVLTANEEPQDRFIAPADLIQRMVDRVDSLKLGEGFDLLSAEGQPIISTIPMPTLMKILGWKNKSVFQSRSGINVVSNIEGVDAYCSLYVPDPTFPAARISITGGVMVAECYGKLPPPVNLQEFAKDCAEKMGLPRSMIKDWPDARKQNYGKILPIDEKERRAFIMWASQEHNVYSLGRFATWRPGLLLDDVVNDVRVIQRLISDNTASYSHKLKD